MKITGCKVVGAMVAPQGKAAFDRASLVVESLVEPGIYTQVRAYVGPDEIEGKPLVREEWEALLRSGQGIAIAEVGATSGAALWVLRRGFEGLEAALEELRTSGALMHDVFRLPGGSFGCLVREPEANTFQDQCGTTNDSQLREV